MESRLQVKSKVKSSERKIIEMVIDGLPSENSRRAYKRALEVILHLARPGKPTGIK